MKRFFQSSYLVIILLLMYIPIFVMMLFSFNSSSNISNFTGFSFKWYAELLNNSPFLKSITTSLFVAITSTIISIVIGVMAVVGLSKLSQKRQSRWISIANIPLINADIITAVSLMVVFLILGLNFGIFTLIAAHVSFNVPYVIITVMPFLKRVDKNIVSASEDLGSSPFQTFFKVVLPILIPSIITAAAICFSMSFDDFIISYFTGGDQTNVSTFIYTAKKIQPYINAFGTLLVITIFLAILGFNIVKAVTYNNEKRRNAVRKSEYKNKAILAYKNQIENNNQIIESGIKKIKTKNLWLLIQYRFLLIRIKMVKNKNYYSKISKLEWEVEVINKKITKDANAQISYDSLVYKKKSLEVKLNSEKNEVKIEKIELQINKLQKRIDKAMDLIERVQHQKAVNEEKAREIQEWIEELKTDLANKEHNDVYVKKSNQKIVNLTIRRQEILDGKSKRKLKTNLIKLNQLKNSQDEKIAILYINLEELKKRVFKEVSLAYEFDLKNNWNILSNSDLTQKRNEYIMLAKQNIESDNNELSQKITEIKNEEKVLKEKYFPTGNDGYSKGKSYIQRTWKTFATIFILVTSFGLITTAYVMNNIYDIVIGNWGSYIDPIVIKKFEKKYGVKVNYQQYDSNEIMYNKNITFRYDVMVPSDYMAVKLAQDNYLMPIDWKLINEYNEELELIVDDETGKLATDADGKVIGNGKLDSNWFEQVKKSNINIETEEGEDPNASLSDYAAPFFWGDVRIAFNTQNSSVVDFLKTNNIDFDDKGIIDPGQLSWNILWDAAIAGLDVALNEDPKNFLMYSLGKKGSVAPKNQSEIDDATKDLKKLIKYKGVGLYTDQLIEKVQTGNFDVAVIYNGDLVSSTYTWMDDRDYPVDAPAPFAQGYVAKKIEGSDKLEVTNTWSDSMVISNSARNADLAHKWIAFILEEEIQDLQFDYSGYLGALSSINDDPENFEYDFLNSWFKIAERGEPFQLNEKLDEKVVEAFNEIRASK
ncbi:spermidine/putrescine ABC transporter permease [Spiroplasma sp. TIUS-1]|uniref:extracellular solute-binding protein n=1 Tax=Spiroplasma sp. TIUS-1 TaxID=216963 RepID=UPI001398D5A0|nr:extracellular solute-binding protein [Spiroplasma sp. TIUS-1]QHX35673.1 spermidine/putrescine ABC transporter permease [Spiroplasma sp. TIUS-1]